MQNHLAFSLARDLRGHRTKCSSEAGGPRGACLMASLLHTLTGHYYVSRPYTSLNVNGTGSCIEQLTFTDEYAKRYDIWRGGSEESIFFTLVTSILLKHQPPAPSISDVLCNFTFPGILSTALSSELLSNSEEWRHQNPKCLMTDFLYITHQMTTAHPLTWGKAESAMSLTETQWGKKTLQISHRI